MLDALPMDLPAIVRRLKDVLVVHDREVTPTGGELTRMKLMALLLDVSWAELAGREEGADDVDAN